MVLNNLPLYNLKAENHLRLKINFYANLSYNINCHIFSTDKLFHSRKICTNISHSVYNLFFILRLTLTSTLTPQASD